MTALIRRFVFAAAVALPLAVTAFAPAIARVPDPEQDCEPPSPVTSFAVPTECDDDEDD